MTFLKRIAEAAALGSSLLLVSGLISSPAQAAYVVTLQEVGGDVVATGSGPIDLTGLTLFGNGGGAGSLLPNGATILTGTSAGGSDDIYTGYTGPTSFGSGFGSGPATSNSGDLVGINKSQEWLYVPEGYSSGDPLSDTSTYAGKSFSTLGVTPGTYVWTWGTGPDQNFTLIIPGVAAVPEPASLALLGTALVGLAGIRRRKRV